MRQFHLTLGYLSCFLFLFAACAEKKNEGNSIHPQNVMARTGYSDEDLTNLLSGITVYELTPVDGGTKIASLQDEYPILVAKEPRIVDADTIYEFVNQSTNGAFRFIVSKGEKVSLQKANSTVNFEQGEFTQESFDAYESTTWAIDSKITHSIFFEELVSALRIAGNSAIKLPTPKIDTPPLKKARCPGSGSSNNSGNVISCLHAIASSDCGGPNSYTHGEPSVSEGGGGSMTYHCIE